MRNLLIGAVLLLVCFGAQAQTVNVPDANLRAIINEELGKSANSTISRAEMATLERLRADDSGVGSLRGLEYAVNLEDLRLYNGTISDLSPLAELEQMHVLHLESHLIRDLSPIAGLTNIEYLSLHHNAIPDLSPLTGFSRLRHLGIHENLMTDYSPIAELSSLTHIWMNNNAEADLSAFAKLTNLESFNSWGTPILDITPLTGLPKMWRLDMCGADLTDISALDGMTQLKWLYLVGNDIRDLTPLASLRNLVEVDLHNNNIVDVSPLAGLSKLTSINVSENQVVDLSPLDAFGPHVIINTVDNPGHTPTPKKLRGPWVWMIASTGNRLGAAAANANVDFLSEASNGRVTQGGVALHGATPGSAVGNREWTAGYLSGSGNNINNMVNDIGLAIGDIDHHVAYGILEFESPRVQNTTMYVGSSDAVRVWLNGAVVHRNAVNRDSTDYDDDFSIRLREGTNRLMIAVYEGKGWWTGMFAFDSDTEFTLIPPSIPTPDTVRIADVNEDGHVNILDVILAARSIGAIKYSNPRVDVDGSGTVNIVDIQIIVNNFDDSPGAPAADSFSPDLIRALLVEARAADDGSVAFREGIANLEMLLAALVPAETQLLANYPNPFNPETWIPYHLASDSEVQVTIYTAAGEVVRRLDLGHQGAGYYTDRDRAAYWNGHNESGERVSSGVYFYELRTDSVSRLRKMVILK